MTVRVTQKMRKRINKIKKELVTDDSYKEIRDRRDEKRKWIYTSPDNGKTIYRQPLSYCDVSDVKIDEGEQLHFDFKEDEVNERAEKMEDILDKLNTIETQVREVRRSALELSCGVEAARSFLTADRAHRNDTN